MAAAFVSRNKAAEFSLDDLLSEDGRSGLLSVSQSTWMLAYSLVSFYGYWRSRYYKLDIDGSMITLDDNEWEQVTDIVDLAIEELSMTGYDDLIAALDGLNNTLLDFKACCQSQIAQTAQLNDGIANDGTISVGGPNDQFATAQDYYNAKCSSANAIYDTILGFVSDMDQSDIANIVSGVSGGVVPVISAKLARSGPLGWAIAKVSAFTTAIAFTLIDAVVDFGDIESALTEQHEPLVLALYNASNTSAAKSSFLNALDQATTSLTAAESGLVADLLTNDLLNQLFDPRSDTVNYQSSDPIDCGAAVDQVWTFDTGLQSWTHSDDSDAGCSASVQHDATNEAIEQSLIVDNAPHVTAWSRNISPTVSIAVVPGGSVQVDFSETSDSSNQLVRVEAFYSDLSEYQADIVTPNAGTLILDLTVSGTLERVEVSFARSTSGTASGSTYTTLLEEVRIYGGS